MLPDDVLPIRTDDGTPTSVNALAASPSVLT